MGDMIPQRAIVIATPRLHLRRFIPADLDAIWAVERDPEVMRYVGKGARTREESQTRLEAAMSHWERHGFGMMAVVHIQDNRLIGRAGLCFLDDTPEIEVGYVLDKPYWGQGLATEAAGACVRYGFEVLGLQRIVAIARPENEASRHVMTKLGMKQEGEGHWYRQVSVYYALSLAAYRVREQ